MATKSFVRRFSRALTITDPLVKYQTLISSGLYGPDPAQHRLARHLQKIYLRIKDYSPHNDYKQRLAEVSQLSNNQMSGKEEDTGGILALKNHAIWRNPLFRHLLPNQAGKESLALTRVLSNYQTAIDIDSPKGLFLSGEVGTGKSMLLDLLAEGLPTKKKKRWHFNTFMLYTHSQLESYRKSHNRVSHNHNNNSISTEYSLLWMAKKLVDESPILFLDEFQLPDRAASKILSHLFIAFFQLGGVLVASSNRMPEELQNAIGVDYAPSRSRGFMTKVLGLQPKGELFGPSSDFANFLEVLKARCDFWQMEGAQDWRRKEEFISREAPLTDVNNGTVATSKAPDVDNREPRKTPYHYTLMSEDDTRWKQSVSTAASWAQSSPVPWEPASLVVYGRRVHTPRHYEGVVYWRFQDLVETFGPADYITMASSYHTFIIDEVPILTTLQKNEARRFITLLDALYEARCKLLMRAQNPPDDLFFPTSRRPGPSPDGQQGAIEDATYSETIAEVYQDSASPFRPNVSYYDTPATTAKYDPDQDSDFGLQKNTLNFSNTSAFTGEDERFAYKRAASRLWELCSAQWHARTGDWWQPLPLGARHWEGSQVSKPLERRATEATQTAGETLGQAVEVDEVAGLSRWRIEELKRTEAASAPTKDSDEPRP